MQKQLSHTQRILVEDIAFFIRTDIHAADKGFPFLNLNVSLLDTAFPHPQRLYFRTVQFQPCLVLLFYKIIVIRFLIIRHQFHGFSGHKTTFFLISSCLTAQSAASSSGMMKSTTPASRSAPFTCTVIRCPSL